MKALASSLRVFGSKRLFLVAVGLPADGWHPLTKQRQGRPQTVMSNLDFPFNIGTTAKLAALSSMLTR